MSLKTPVLMPKSCSPDMTTYASHSEIDVVRRTKKSYIFCMPISYPDTRIFIGPGGAIHKKTLETAFKLADTEDPFVKSKTYLNVSPHEAECISPNRLVVQHLAYLVYLKNKGAVEDPQDTPATGGGCAVPKPARTYSSIPRKPIMISSLDWNNLYTMACERLGITEIFSEKVNWGDLVICETVDEIIQVLSIA